MKLQFHLLTAFPPHNVNRDEDGRPKTALLGASPRGRISSQAKKRALRFAPHFKDCQRATRTREAGILAFRRLVAAGLDEVDAAFAALGVNFALGGGDAKPTRETAQDLMTPQKRALDERERTIERIMAKEGKERAAAEVAAKDRALGTEQGLVVSTRERKRLDAALADLITAHRDELAGTPAGVQAFVDRLARDKLLTREDIDEDTALFGRMVAADPSFNVEAAVAVSHAITTHEFAIEGDYFSAGEELNVLGGTGAAITSYAFFGSGTYYQHVVADVDHLRANLDADGGRVERALGALLDGLAFAQPTGKRNSFASDVCASYILVDRGDSPTCNLATAFLEPVRTSDPMTASIGRLKTFHNTLIEAYGFEVESLAFNGWQPARVGNAPPTGEVWTYEVLRRFVLAGVT